MPSLYSHKSPSRKRPAAMPKKLEEKPGLYLEAQTGTGPSMFQHTFSAPSFITIGDKYGQ